MRWNAPEGRRGERWYRRVGILFTARSKILNVKLQLLALEYVTGRLLSAGVKVVNAVLMERGRLVAMKNVRKARWIRQTENAESVTGVSVRQRRHEHDATYEGSNRGAHTMAMLSGNMTW
jgi:hypothetical protein